MDVIRRHLILASQPMQYGGITVWLDNAYLPRSDGTSEDVINDPNWFVTGWYDSGSTGGKSYTYLRQAIHNISGASMRFFNDKDAKSVDWWAAAASSEDSTQTISSAGQYILFSVYKPSAANIYLYCNTTGTYIFKGSNVT